MTHQNITNLEKRAKALTCADLGSCQCNAFCVRAQYPHCQRSTRGLAGMRLGQRNEHDLTVADSLVESSPEVALQFERRYTQIERSEAQYWLGREVDFHLAPKLIKYCIDEKICAHDVRMLFNAGLMRADLTHPRPIAFAPMGLIWYDLISQAIFMVMVAGYGFYLMLSESLRYESHFYGGMALLFSTVMLFFLMLQGPILRLLMAKRLKATLEAFNVGTDFSENGTCVRIKRASSD